MKLFDEVFLPNEFGLRIMDADRMQVYLDEMAANQEQLDRRLESIEVYLGIPTKDVPNPAHPIGADFYGEGVKRILDNVAP